MPSNVRVASKQRSRVVVVVCPAPQPGAVKRTVAARATAVLEVVADAIIPPVTDRREGSAGGDRAVPAEARAAGFGPRLTRRPLIDQLIVRFPAVGAFVVQIVLQLPAGRLRRACLAGLLARCYAAYDRMDVLVTYALFAEDVEWHLLDALPGDTDVLRGRDAVIGFYNEVTADWDHRIRFDGLEDHGDGRVSVHAINVLTSRATGLSSELRDIDELHFRRGRVVLVREVLDETRGSPWRGLTADSQSTSTQPPRRAP